MKAVKTLAPGDPDTKKAMLKYGEKLIYVRYRIDDLASKKCKTVELIKEEIYWKKDPKRIPMNRIIEIKIHVKETRTRGIVKAAGGRWNPINKTWKLPYSEVLNLGLEKRIVLNKAEK